MTDETEPPPAILDGSGKPARQSVGPVRCPRCHVESPTGDPKKRVRSGGFGADVHDVCLNCGYEFEGELTV
jgi:hypothetical protein